MARADLDADDRLFIEQALGYSSAQMHLADVALGHQLSESAGLYARGMASYHHNLYGQLVKLARAKGLEIVEAPPPWQADPQLERLQGAAFERGYAQQQVQWQMRALTELRQESEHSQDADLKTYATARLPVIERHLGMAQALLESPPREAAARP